MESTSKVRVQTDGVQEQGEVEGSVWRQPRAVWAVAVFASIFVLFSGRAYLSKA